MSLSDGLTWWPFISGVLAWMLITVGAVFFLAGTIGLVRFPDLYSRLHAVTKADNLGLGLVCLGLALNATTPSVALKVLLIWLLVLLASAVTGHLVARYGLRSGIKPWRQDG